MTKQCPANAVPPQVEHPASGSRGAKRGGIATREASVNRTRRGVVAAASAATVLCSAPGASGQGRADQRDFEGVLRAAFAPAEVPNWTGGNVRLKRPIVIEVTQTWSGRGLT